MVVGLNFVFSFTDLGLMGILDALYSSMQDFSAASAVQERSLVQLGAALRATGKDAEISVEELADFAAELQKITKFGDELIIESSKWFAQMPRLDPKEIKNYQAATADLAEVMGTDLRTAAQVLARALEDPRRASRALRRANIMLSTEERRMLETFDEANEVAKAQAVIMNAVQASVGGAAEAMASTLEGRRSQIRGIYADMQEHFGRMPNEFLFPLTEALRDSMQAWSEALGKMNDDVLKVSDSFKELRSRAGEFLPKDTAEFLEQAAKNTNDWAAAGHSVVNFISTMKGILVDIATWGNRGQEAQDGFMDFVEGMAVGVGFDLQTGRELAAMEELKKAQREYWAEVKRTRDEERRAAEGAKSREEAAAIERAMAAEKERLRLRKAFIRESEAWIERMVRAGQDPWEKFITDLNRIADLQKKGLATARERAKIQEGLVERYWESVGAAKAMERIQSDLKRTKAEEARRVEQIRKMDARITRERERQASFTSSMTSLTGLWDAMATAAMSTTTGEEDQLKEMERQRAVLMEQLNETRGARAKAEKQRAETLLEIRRRGRAIGAAVFSR